MATTVARLQAVLAADTGQFDKSMDKSEGRMRKLSGAAKLGGLAFLAVGLLRNSIQSILKSSL